MTRLTLAGIAFALLARSLAACSQTSSTPAPTVTAPVSALAASPTPAGRKRENVMRSSASSGGGPPCPPWAAGPHNFKSAAPTAGTEARPHYSLLNTASSELPPALNTTITTPAKAIAARIQAQSLALVPPPVTEVFGHSTQGRPLVAYILGNGPNVTLICGAFHGNEGGSAVVVSQLLGYLQQHPEQLIGCRVVLVPQVNPDGLTARQRANARGVDLNRNFPGNWQPQPFRARYHPGSYPASEPETQACIGLIKRYGPTKVISLHSPFHTMDWTGERSHALARVMQQFNHYPMTDNIGYPTPGSLGNYCGRVLGIAIITLELPLEAASLSWANNREALLAAIRYHD